MQGYIKEVTYGNNGDKESTTFTKEGENIVCKYGLITNESAYFSNEVSAEMRKVIAFLVKIKDDAKNYGVDTKELENITRSLESQDGFSVQELINLYNKIIRYIESVVQARNEIEFATEKIRKYASKTSRAGINHMLTSISSSLVFEPLLQSCLTIARAELDMIA